MKMIFFIFFLFIIFIPIWCETYFIIKKEVKKWKEMKRK